MATGKQTFDRAIYGNSGGSSGGTGAGVGMGSPGQIAKKMNLRSKGRKKSRAKRK